MNYNSDKYRFEAELMSYRNRREPCGELFQHNIQCLVELD